MLEEKIEEKFEVKLVFKEELIFNLQLCLMFVIMVLF